MADEQQVSKYSVMLADLEAERTKLDNAIQAMRQLIGVEGANSSSLPTGSAAPSSPQSKSLLPSNVDFDTFFSLSIPEAIKKYLAMKKRPQTVADITSALEAGGLSTTATNLMGTITATLFRMRQTSGEVVPVRRGEWGLTEWYPGRRFDKPERKKSKKRDRKPKQQAKAPAKKKAAPAEPASASVEQKPPMSWKPTPDQIERIKTLHAAGKKPGEISKETGVAAMAVGRIVAHEAKATVEAKVAS